ncbi:MAG: MFS transporter [Ilumatobacteraceae bacterium]
MNDEDRASLQTRTLRVLVTGQIAGAAALAAAVTVGAFVIQDILGQDTPWGGVASATVTMGTAFMSQVLARVMTHRGRRGGLRLGYGLAVVGGTIAGVGVEMSSLWIFLAGLFLFGNGQASNLLSRYAATDLALPTERGRAMSRILFASTFGAVFGPLLIRPAERMGQEWFGWQQYTGPWIFAAVFLTLSFVNVTLRLRTDPLEASGGLSRQSAVGVERPNLRAMFVTVGESADARLALLTMVISQMTMVAVMTMTPVHLKSHGHEAISSFIISLHIGGMYAFSPLIGRFSDTQGRLATIKLGAMLLLLATLTAALAGDQPALLFPSLWLLGLGWSCGLIGGSSLLLDSISTDQRVRIQGTADLSMSFFGGLAGFASGFVRRAVGYTMLANLASLLAATLVIAVLSRRVREPV